MPAKPKLHNPYHPKRTLLYQSVAELYEIWLKLASAGQFDGQGERLSPKPQAREAFEEYLWNTASSRLCLRTLRRLQTRHLVALSSKGRGACPLCITRRMVETAAYRKRQGVALHASAQACQAG